ncbi:MAG: cytochrome c biogenesis protein ResB [Verrucomicrobia bacterium]|nr:cytochrome c biogenesis protein ResB [Verrucomicrobiota bacterium]MDA1087270.1 cytochrome c biogenesis protein ResB [Verrucomicrobiota bacterium]
MRDRLARTPLIRFATSLKIPVICLGLLLVIVFWGTLYQKDFGLYEAQQRFFYSWVIMIFGVIPFPGSRLVLWCFFVALSLTMIFKMQYTRRTIGLVIVHVGVLSFFVTAFVSFHFSQHSSLYLAEGMSSTVSADYRDWELSAWTMGESDETRTVRDVLAVDGDKLAGGESFQLPEFGLTVDVLEYSEHCRPLASGSNPYHAQSQAGIASLQTLPRRSNPQENTPGGYFRVTGTDGHQHTYLLHAEDPRPARMVHRENPVHLALRRKRYALPLTVRLIDFERRVHPGTQVASSFSSRVEVGEGAASRSVLIYMNEPFRHKAFTFFQSSFTPDEKGSVFAVVENPGRVLPYVSSTVTFAGLMVHFLMMLWRAIRRPGARAPSGRAVPRKASL